MAGNYDPDRIGRYILAEVLVNPFSFCDHLLEVEVARLRTVAIITHTWVAPHWQDLEDKNVWRRRRD